MKKLIIVYGSNSKKHEALFDQLIQKLDEDRFMLVHAETDSQIEALERVAHALRNCETRKADRLILYSGDNLGLLRNLACQKVHASLVNRKAKSYGIKGHSFKKEMERDIYINNLMNIKDFLTNPKLHHN